MTNASAAGGDGSSAETPLYRPAVRALLMDPDDGAVLLMRSRFPGWKRAYWLTPGGGLDADETPEQGLLREVFEETGLETGPAAIVGGPVWTRRVRYEWRGVHYDQHEHFFLLHIDRFEPDPEANPAAHETEALETFGWWTAAAMARTHEGFVPRGIVAHIGALHRGERPAKPFDIGL
ncbi:MAG: NUDIX domain-containing protein [Pseudomonadales bacterium]|nr:NUDIX domain-containing protein [Pseudomonadales bacterium]